LGSAELPVTFSLTWVLALTPRILLLLAGLLAAALLLARLLTRVLVLLARVLVLAGHRDLPC
jgi:type IV secretory pathway TrbL component